MAITTYSAALDVLRNCMETGKIGERIQAAAVALRAVCPVAHREETRGQVEAVVGKLEKALAKLL